ncbi:MAG TPA: aminotransferase class I/II-fold pyridoxal phosphate-dependent enzyme [Thermopetrobacter sp.]|nr:aminotransferase class I/II-fold pyridoxal phosphate-dependent enzyme [Thermopetrobacter sp.]
MKDLLEKYRPLVAHHDRAVQAGVDPINLVNERVLSPSRAVINGREVVLAGTNNYMGITFDPDCIAAGQEALASFGAGTTGSRIANGTYALHAELERALANALNREHCLIFSTGYQANLASLAGLAGKGDTIFLDADSHASIHDGATLSGAEIIWFRHNDPDNLARRLRRHQGEGGVLVVLEGLYSMFGDRAPLREFVEVKKEFGFQLLVDEAHSFGVLGEHGRGLAEEAGVEDEVDFVVGTFSKSIGAIGGFAASNHPMFEALRFAARPYMFTAAPSPASVATALCAVRKLQAEPERRTRLMDNARRLRDGLKELGLRIACEEETPIIAVMCDDEEQVVRRWNALLQAGVYVNLALPPGTPGNSYLLRCSATAAMDEKDIADIIAGFAAALRMVG